MDPTASRLATFASIADLDPGEDTPRPTAT